MKKNLNNASKPEYLLTFEEKLARDYPELAAEIAAKRAKKKRVFPDWVCAISFLLAATCFPLTGLFGGWAALGMLIFGAIAVMSGGEIC